MLLETTPQLALNLPPLGYVAEAKKSAWRINSHGLWSSRKAAAGHSEILKAKPKSDALDMPSDKMYALFYFDRPFHSRVCNKTEWDTISPDMLSSNCWFTDGSLMSDKAGAGIFCNNPATSIALDGTCRLKNNN